jgi:hypothetical protein
MRRMTRVFPFGLVALVLGCDSLTGPEEKRVAGIIAGVNPDDPHIVVPDTVQAGKAFTVAVRTYGLKGCVRKGETEIQAGDREAVVLPYNVKLAGDNACSDVMQVLEHTATLQFNRTGTARVVVIGRRAPQEELLLIRHEVVVQ